VITVVGAGFAGVEAAWAAATRGVPVVLYEMRPVKRTPAHTTDYFAELVCSNSLKSKSPTSPAGQLKYEMEGLGSLVLSLAKVHAVPGGEALCVDRDAFGAAITKAISEHPLIEIRREEFSAAMAESYVGGSKGLLVLASGPLTSPELSEWLAEKTGRKHLYFYDAVSPTVDASTLDMDIVFAQSRYDKGEGDDYLNCPFNKENYEAFVAELVAAERAPIHAFEAGGVRGEVEVDDSYKLPLEERLLEQIKYFAGCMPIEAIAEKGARSLAFGNFKPMGLTNPATGRRPWAALQLRPENKDKTLYSLVACQTRLKFGEQRRIFRMVPGLENADFVRYGVIHRNTYIEAPTALDSTLQLKSAPGIYISGQLNGVEGYVESAAMGILTGINAVRKLAGQTIPEIPRACAYGALMAHLQDDTPREFAPMNINWGILPDPPEIPRDKALKRQMKLDAAREAYDGWLGELKGLQSGSVPELEQLV
jgi:methylenetetrahydrofolate--tRNA-(uracil-5-)-methyltransferase